MRGVELSPSLRQAMERHAQGAYPDECCGFLLGNSQQSGTHRTILDIEPTPNEYDGERRHRFVIGPDELRAIERRLEGTDREVVGFYHSHPDHPARPSLFDQEHAWPWWTYLVLSVTASGVPAIGAFELDPESGSFHEVPLGSTDPEKPSVMAPR